MSVTQVYLENESIVILQFLFLLSEQKLFTLGSQFLTNIFQELEHDLKGKNRKKTQPFKWYLEIIPNHFHKWKYLV